MDPEEALARRRAEEAAVRARLQTAPGVASPAQVAGRSGLQIFQALLAGEIPPALPEAAFRRFFCTSPAGLASRQITGRYPAFNPSTFLRGPVGHLLQYELGEGLDVPFDAGLLQRFHVALTTRQSNHRPGIPT